MLPLTTKSGVQIGRDWTPIAIPRELTYEELWAQRLLIGGGVRHARHMDWSWMLYLALLATMAYVVR